MHHILAIGATRGIGRTFLRGAVREECKAWVVGRSQTADFDFDVHQRIHRLEADLASANSLQHLVAEINATVPHINHLIFFQRFRGDDPWEGELQVSLTATKTLIESLVDRFEKAQNNAITLISSMADRYIASEQDLGYHVAKAGMSQMVRFYAVKLGPLNIRVNGVCSGAVIKEESAAFYDSSPQLKSLYSSITPLGRMGTADDIANVVKFLGSPQSSFITGQCLVVDGGISLQWHESLARRLTLPGGK